MGTPANHTDLLARTYLTIVDNESGMAEARIGKHEALLTQIVSGLGFNKIESRRILEDVFSQAKKQYRNYSDLSSFKVWLSRILVRKCVFEISKDFFSGKGNVRVRSWAFGSYSTGTSIFGTGREQIPLSFGVVYLLYTHIGFTEREIAEILNTSPLSVRERLNKALQFISRA